MRWSVLQQRPSQLSLPRTGRHGRRNSNGITAGWIGFCVLNAKRTRKSGSERIGSLGRAHCPPDPQACADRADPGGLRRARRGCGRGSHLPVACCAGGNARIATLSELQCPASETNAPAAASTNEPGRSQTWRSAGMRILMIHVVIALLAAMSLVSCSTQRELSDDEWCRSFEYREGTRQYAECRARIDRQRQRGERARQ